MKSIVLSCFLIVSSLAGYCRGVNLYLSPTGNDSNNGLSPLTPLFTLSKAITLATVGDIINVASGTYPYTTGSISLSKDSVTIRGIFTKASDRPVFDFTGMTFGSYGLRLNGNYAIIYGIVIKGAKDNGIVLDRGGYHTVEFCDFIRNADSGLQIKGGSHHNKIINCDSYFNVDASQGNADGFANKLDAGSFNSFKGCRAWQNSDDGWDGLLGTVNYTPNDTLIDCWAYKNGYLENGNKSAGNGNGFKLGGTQGGATGGPFIHRQTVIRCLSALHPQKGFDYNNNAGSMTILNCTGFGNAGLGNFAFPNAVASGEIITLKNNVSFDAKFGVIHASAIQETNSWTIPSTVTAEDFLSIDPTEMLRPRKDDGSLPDINFMRPSPTSDLIDAGTNIGLPFMGNKPDLGCFEYPWALGLEEQNTTLSRYTLYPNPAQGLFKFKNKRAESVIVKIFNILGEEVSEKNVAGNTELTISLDNQPTGRYILQATSKDGIDYCNLILQ